MIKKILTLFTKRFMIYNCIIIMSLFPVVFFSIVTNVVFFDMLLIINYVLMLFNAGYIIIMICKNKNKLK